MSCPEMKQQEGCCMEKVEIKKMKKKKAVLCIKSSLNMKTGTMRLQPFKMPKSKEKKKKSGIWYRPDCRNISIQNISCQANKSPSEWAVLGDALPNGRLWGCSSIPIGVPTATFHPQGRSVDCPTLLKSPAVISKDIHRGKITNCALVVGLRLPWQLPCFCMWPGCMVVIRQKQYHISCPGCPWLYFYFEARYAFVHSFLPLSKPPHLIFARGEQVWLLFEPVLGRICNVTEVLCQLGLCLQSACLWEVGSHS